LTKPLDDLVEEYPETLSADSDLSYAVGGYFYILEDEKEIEEYGVSSLVKTEEAYKVFADFIVHNSGWWAVWTATNNAGGPTYIFKTDNKVLEETLKAALIDFAKDFVNGDI